jgi:nucleoside-diphosphate-sugar epimerase
MLGVIMSQNPRPLPGLKTALVLGAGGFIGSHMVKRLKSEGLFVVGVDLKFPEFSESLADVFHQGDLREMGFVTEVINSLESPFDEVYQFAADMGGAGFVFSGENDAEIMHNSAVINLNVLDALKSQKEAHPKEFNLKIFYSGSACMYPEHNQLDPDNPNLEESSAYPANPDSEYGWEKLFSERLYFAFSRNHGIKVAVARFHNIYGPEGTWTGGREKAPAAIARKVAELDGDQGEIEVWGDGHQTRSFLYIDDCIEATRRLMESDFPGPINIGSEEMVSINQLVGIAAKVSGKRVTTRHKLNAPTGVRGRNSDNRLIRKVLDWDYQVSLEEGMSATYSWIEMQRRSGLKSE